MIWRSLRNHSISEQYSCLLKKLYADQHATVLADVGSEEFEIERALASICETKKLCTSNLRFADDVLLMANSLSQLKKMMTDFKRSPEAQGLEIHRDKEKILTNQKTNRHKEIE